MPDVYRAPMRSRRDDLDLQPTIDRPLTMGLVGVFRLGRIDGPLFYDDAGATVDREPILEPEVPVEGLPKASESRCRSGRIAQPN